MKNILILLLLLPALSSVAQTKEIADTSNNQLKFKINYMVLRPEISFEYIINNKISAGAHVSSNIFNFFPSISVTPYLRLYQSKVTHSARFKSKQVFIEQGIIYGYFNGFNYDETELEFTAFGTQTTLGVKQMFAQKYGREFYIGLKLYRPITHGEDINYDPHNEWFNYNEWQIGPGWPLIMGGRFIF